MHLNWAFEDFPPGDDVLLADLLEVPEIKRHLIAGHSHDDDLGLRDLLEKPEALSLPHNCRARNVRRRGPTLQDAA